jgi:hypothetical protein
VVVPREGKAPLVMVDVFAREPASVREETLVVRDARGQWTPAFSAVRAAMGMPPTPPGK